MFTVTIKAMGLVQSLAKGAVYRLLEIFPDVIMALHAGIFEHAGQRVLAGNGVSVVACRAFGKIARALAGESAVNTNVIAGIDGGASSLRRVHSVVALSTRFVHAIGRKRRAGCLRRENVVLAVAARALQRAFVAACGDLCRSFGMTTRAVHRLERLIVRKVIEALQVSMAIHASKCSVLGKFQRIGGDTERNDRAIVECARESSVGVTIHTGRVVTGKECEWN